MRIEKINARETYDFILNKHYAKRKPSISFAYGLFDKDELKGILTIGKPASNSLCVGVCGKEYSKNVYELNRLCVVEGLKKNSLSFFVGGVMKLLRNKEIILVSYADKGMSHCGYIYQATNWVYTGMTKGRTDKYTPKGKHSRHYTNENEHLRKVRTEKYRYIYIPNKKYRKEVMKNLKYEIVKEYPKLNSVRYVLGDEYKQKIFNRITKEYYYE